MSLLTPAPAGGAAATAAARRGWRPVQYLALAGAALVVLEVWTWASWLAAGPRPITRWQDGADPSWYAARVYEGLMALVVIGVSVHVVRGVRRERRLTLDAMMVVGGASTLFWDPMVNWLQPNFLYSSNWLVAATFVAAGLVCVALEGPMFLLHLWALPGAPAEFALFGDAHRFAWAEYLTTTLVFGLLGVLRYFRDDRGRSLVERDLATSPRAAGR